MATTTSNLEQFLDKLNRAESLYEKECISAATQILHECDTEFLYLDVTDRDIAAQRMESESIQKMRSLGYEVHFLLRLLQHSTAWKVWGSSSGMTLSSQEEAFTGRFFFKVEGILDIEPIYIVAALMEVELYPKWMSRCVHAEVLKSLSTYRRLVFSIMDYFFFKRESLMIGYGDTLLDGGLFLYVKTVHEKDPILQNITLPPCDHPRVDVEGGFLVREVEVQNAAGEKVIKSHTSICFKVDPKIECMPTWLFNFLMRTAIWYLLPMLENQAKQFRPGQPLHHKLEESKDIYDEVHRKLQVQVQVQHDVSNESKEGVEVEVEEDKEGKALSKDPEH
eukprot:gene6188-12538_t